MLAYENPAVIRRIATDELLTEEEATRAFRGLLQFLFVAATATGPSSPSYYIDRAWHAFILQTRDYADFCDRYFGHFIHHDNAEPAGSDDSSNAIYLETRAAAAAQFDLDEVIWPLPHRSADSAGLTLD